MEKHRERKPEISRLDTLTDGVFAIVATLLVLDVKLPDIMPNRSQHELIVSLVHVLPSFIAFAFSFITVIIYWINHDHISKWMTHYDQPMKYMNLLLLFWICLIPFPTKFISEYHEEPVAVMAYGLEMMLVAITANIMYWYIAFLGKLLDARITMATRKKYFNRIIGGPIIYFIAMILSFVDVRISIGIYIIVPLLFVVMPKAELTETENL